MDDPNRKKLLEVVQSEGLHLTLLALAVIVAKQNKEGEKYSPALAIIASNLRSMSDIAPSH